MKYKIIHIENNKERKAYVHADHPFMDYTLCGLALEGSVGDHDEAIESNSKITCKHCIDTIKHCKLIKL